MGDDDRNPTAGELRQIAAMIHQIARSTPPDSSAAAIARATASTDPTVSAEARRESLAVVDLARWCESRIRRDCCVPDAIDPWCPLRGWPRGVCESIRRAHETLVGLLDSWGLRTAEPPDWPLITHVWVDQKPSTIGPDALAILDGAANVLERAAIEAEASPPPLTIKQREILDTLRGTSMLMKDLMVSVGLSERHCRSELQALKELGRVANAPGVGFYRPDRPPADD